MMRNVMCCAKPCFEELSSKPYQLEQAKEMRNALTAYIESQEPKEKMMTELLKQREQLMEDIDCIVSAQYGQNEELADEMIILLCNAVCKNFP